VPITLSNVRGKFRTIERETADYMIGSVPLTNYPENYDVHVYVHKDGWILAYYLKQDPASKIFDWRAYDTNGATLITTKLENAITTIVNAVGVSLTTTTYYDFRYPNATKIMLVAEEDANGNGDSFDVNVPQTFVVFERSWSLAGRSLRSYYLDEVLIQKQESYSDWGFLEGILNVSQLLPNQFHIVKIDGWPGYEAYGGLALIYKEQ